MAKRDRVEDEQVDQQTPNKQLKSQTPKKQLNLDDETVPEEQTPSKKQPKFDDDKVPDEQDESESESESESQSDSDSESGTHSNDNQEKAGVVEQEVDIEEEAAVAVDVVGEEEQVAAVNVVVEEEKDVDAVAEEEEVDIDVVGGEGVGRDVVVVEEVGLEKKPFFNRLWNFDDEIVLLQSMIDFNDKNKDKDKDPQDGFYNFVKGKLHNTKFTKSQVGDKLQKLRKKLRNNLVKKSSFVGNDLKVFELSKTIWGHLYANNDNNSALVLVKDKSKRVDYEKKGSVKEKDLQHLMKGFEGNGLPNLTLLESCKPYLRKANRGLLEEWDRKWKEIHIAETNAFLGRLALIQEQTTWFKNQMESSQD